MGVKMDRPDKGTTDRGSVELTVKVLKQTLHRWYIWEGHVQDKLELWIPREKKDTSVVTEEGDLIEVKNNQKKIVS